MVTAGQDKRRVGSLRILQCEEIVICERSEAKILIKKVSFFSFKYSRNPDFGTSENEVRTFRGTRAIACHILDTQRKFINSAICTVLVDIFCQIIFDMSSDLMIYFNMFRGYHEGCLNVSAPLSSSDKVR